jgi:hypothetical protein
MTFWHESAPAEWIRVDDGKRNKQNTGRLYWVGPAERILEAYRPLCHAHHVQTDPNLGWKFQHRAMIANRPATSKTGRGYGTAHKAARALLENAPCAEQDETCRGRIFASLNLDAPTEHLYVDLGHKNGAVYSLDPNDYDPLCHSHAARRDIRGREELGT